MIGFVQNDWFAGEFVWTGFDYLGEPTPWNGTSSGSVGTWPAPKSSYFGIVDTAGFEKDTYYFYRSIWKRDDTTLHVLPAWKEGKVYVSNGKVPVVVYSNAASVKLTFTAEDGTVTDLGTKTFTEYTTDNGYTYQMYEGADKESTNYKNLYLTWYVPYADGTITATAYDKDGNVIEETTGRNSVSTYGDAYALAASADRTEIAADGSDLAYITVDVKDANGLQVEDAANNVTFTVEGEGELVGVDNGNAADHQSFQDDNRNAFSGKVLAIVRSTNKSGTIKVTASAEGLESSTVTITTTGGQEEVVLESLDYSRTMYLRKGVTPELPATAVAMYSDGTSKTVNIEWNALPEMSTSGTYTVTGTAAGAAVTMNLIILDEVAYAQNYTCATPVGTIPSLPETRPVYLADGSEMAAQFPVEWEEVTADQVAAQGTFTVNGVVNVLGETQNVTAVVRVCEKTSTMGNNVMSYAFKLEQNIPEEYQSDSLDAIKDKSTAFEPGGSNGNTTCWSNYNWAEAGNNTSEITLSMDTKQTVGKMTLYFGKDGWSAMYPDAGTTKLYYSDDKENWTEISMEETIGDEIAQSSSSMGVKPYTYTFDTVSATYFKLAVTNASGSAQAGFTCTAIVEMELYGILESYVTGSTASLASMTINGEEVDAASLSKGVVKTEAWIAEVEAVGADNASVTILPVYEDVIRIIVESEDHSVTNTVTVLLKQPKQVGADDDSHDYDTSLLTASADSEYPGTGNEGPVRYVLDGNTDTYFHTDWSNNKTASLEERHIDLTFDEAKEVNALRYLPRNGSGSGGQNGMVVTYEIQYKENDEDDWTTIATGSWAQETGWKVAVFDKTVMAKSIRFIGVETVTNGTVNNQHMSAAEVRLTYPDKSMDLSELDNVVVTASDAAVSDLKDADPSKAISVSVDGTALRYGMDYILTYDDITEGANEITVQGICSYTGTVTTTWNVTVKTPEPEPTPETDTYLLNLLVKECQKAYDNQDSYIETGKAEFISAFEAAKAALENDADQDTIDAAVNDLNQAYLNLRLKASEELLKALAQAKDALAALDANNLSEEQAALVSDAAAQVDEALSKAGRSLLSAKEAREVLNNVQNVLSEVGSKEDLIIPPLTEEENEPSLSPDLTQALQPAVTEEAVEPSTTENAPAAALTPAADPTKAESVSTDKAESVKSDSVKTAAATGTLAFGALGSLAAAAAWILKKRNN